MEKSFEIADLIIRKLNGSITVEEEKILEEWLNESPSNKTLFERISSSDVQLDKLEVYSLFRKEKTWSIIEEKISSSKTIQWSTRRILSYAAAILFPVILVGGLAYNYISKSKELTIASIDTLIKPGSQKAVLVLSDGGTMELDKEKLQTEIEEGDAIIKNQNNSLIYSDEAKPGRRKELIYNELRTPRGGGYNLNLSDGTVVWLNAGSILKFPVSFTDSTRRVYLDGEGYFEVSHNGKPFIVSTEDMDVRVLGTSFNLSAYSDESEIATTLVEGKVRIEYTGKNESVVESKILTPNKQALLNRYLAKISIEEVNINHYTSWMEGKLEFSNEPLDIVLKRLARWYDFDYEFENEQAKDYHFTARINNTENISTILGMLEMTTDVKFEYKANKIVVK